MANDPRYAELYNFKARMKKRKRDAIKAACVAVESLPHFEAEAKARQSMAGGDKSLVENIPQAEMGKARDKAAVAVGVNSHHLSELNAIKTNGKSKTKLP